MSPICSGRPSTLLGMSTTSCGSAWYAPFFVTLLPPRSSQSPAYGICACAAVGAANADAAKAAAIIQLNLRIDPPQIPRCLPQSVTRRAARGVVRLDEDRGSALAGRTSQTGGTGPAYP